MIAISSIYGLLQVEQINTVTNCVQTNKQKTQKKTTLQGVKLVKKILGRCVSTIQICTSMTYFV